MKGGALLLALSKAKPKAKAEGEADGGAQSEAKVDLANALDEWQAATTPEAKADAFLAVLDLADECRGYMADGEADEE